MTGPEDQPGVTPTDQLFTYHIFGTPEVSRVWQGNPSIYTLRVAGRVDRALDLSLAQIRGDYEAVTGEMVLQCMTNVHWGRIRVTGARLLDILEKVGIQEAAFKLAFRGVDGFTTDLRIDEIEAEPDRFLVAYEMNGERLSVSHGFPVRLAADGRYGYKWPKWLTEIEVVDQDFKGHYEGKRGWSETGKRGAPVE